MARVKKWLLALLLLALFVVALLAAVDNSQEVALKFLEYETPLWPVSWWMLVAFGLGALFGNLLGLVSSARLRMGVRAANKAAAQRARELDRVQAERNPQAEQAAPRR